MAQQPSQSPHGAPFVLAAAKVALVADGADAPGRHVALVGMPGSGKSTVGAALARSLGLPFVDLDVAIEEAAQKSIAALFAEQGEVMFRAKERAKLREVLANVQPCVIACGGGTWADATMQKDLLAASRPVLLSAPIDVLLDRLQDERARSRRPLLHGPDPRAALERLWRSREPMHARCAMQLDTCDRTVPQVVDLLTQLLAAPAETDVQAETSDGKPVRATAASTAPAPPPLAAHAGHATPGRDQAPAPAPATPGPAVPLAGAPAETGAPAPEAALPLLQAPGIAGSYPIYLVHEGAPAVADCVDAFSTGHRIAVVSDTGVAPNHAEPLLEALRARGLEVSLHTFAAGEEAKRLATAHALYDELADAGHGRGDLLLSLGGGLVSDVAGFVASTYMRGIPFLQVPTSTLAAVDACLGSKTGLNTHRGKNLLGSFYDPQAVVIALPYLGTQQPRAHAAGLVEALKAAALADADLFAIMREAPDLSAARAPQRLAQIIGRSLRIKARLVAEDMHERGQRALLNLGHTLGHAIERGENYRLLHGEAVALGMVAEAEFAQASGLAHGVVEPLTQALLAMGVPVDWRRSKIDVNALRCDKKRRGTIVSLPVVMPLGQARLHQVPMAELVAFATAHSR